MPTRTLITGALAALALGALPTPAAATVDLTAIGIRIGDHPATVRVVVDLVDGRLRTQGVEVVDPDPFDGSARVRITSTRVRTEAAPRSAFGVRASLHQGTGTISLRLTADRMRFKYVASEIIHGFPERLVVELWKSRPPTTAATVLRAPDRCLTFTALSASPGRLVVRGTERGLFEHQFSLRIRGRYGKVLASRAVLSGGGAWRRTITYDVASVRRGTLEAVDFSARDGALVCIVQRPVTPRPA